MVKDEEVPSLEKQLQDVQQKLEDVSNEIEHSRAQENTLKEASGIL